MEFRCIVCGAWFIEGEDDDVIARGYHNRPDPDTGWPVFCGELAPVGDEV